MEGPTSGPHMVRVKFSDVHEMLLEAFPGDRSSPPEVSRLLRAAFPSVQAKRDTKGKRETFYLGLEVRCSPPSAPSSASLEMQLSDERSRNRVLMGKIQQLEQQMQQAIPVVMYKEEFSALTEENMFFSGPDSLGHLDSFSISSIFLAIKEKAPNLVSLFCDLGETRRNARDEKSTTQEEIKTLTSISTLANARSQRSNGIQLFLSIMLIARAVNKQVR